MAGSPFVSLRPTVCAGICVLRNGMTDGVEEDYIDLRPVLRNLMIDPKKFLGPVKRVEVSYA